MPESNGLTIVRSRRSFGDTISELQRAIRQRGMKIFAIIDHAEEALAHEMKMPPAKVILFGSARAGTTLMLKAPSLAIDLPLKLLVSEDRDGAVSMTYNAPPYLAARHGLTNAYVHAFTVIAAIPEETGYHHPAFSLQ